MSKEKSFLDQYLDVGKPVVETNITDTNLGAGRTADTLHALEKIAKDLEAQGKKVTRITAGKNGWGGTAGYEIPADHERSRPRGVGHVEFDHPDIEELEKRISELIDY